MQKPALLFLTITAGRSNETDGLSVLTEEHWAQDLPESADSRRLNSGEAFSAGHVRSTAVQCVGMAPVQAG